MHFLYLIISCFLAFNVNAERFFTADIDNSPVVLENLDKDSNSLEGSVYELLQEAEESILIISFSFSDTEVINIINQKADEGVDVKLVIDRDHLKSLSELSPNVQVSTRAKGDGHLHHKILVVDEKYVWLSSANFTPGSLSSTKNLGVAFFSPQIGAQLAIEAANIPTQRSGLKISPLTTNFQDQLLELYLLPHNDPKLYGSTEAKMNEIGKEKLLQLISEAKHSLKISVDVWTFKDASRAVIEAYQRGVKVDVAVGQTTDEAVKMLRSSGISVKQAKGLHYKFMLVDDKTLLNGSPNWSMNAFSRSDESFVVLYNLNSAQLETMNGVLKSSGLPTDEQPVFTEITIADLDDESSQKLAKINETIELMEEEISKTSQSLENRRVINIAGRIIAALKSYTTKMQNRPLPGLCNFDGDNYLVNVVAIAEKQERVQAALKYIETAKNVNQATRDYFEKALSKLQMGQNVPLPDYFHATRAGLESIIASQTILQSETGYTGPGAYVSCNNEGNLGYGSHTFAIDESVLVDTQAIFRTGRNPNTNVFFSLWASVLKDIPISDDAIAFIDTSASDIPYVQSLLDAQNLKIEVIDRDTAEEILTIFDLTTKRRELPSFYWEKYRENDYLPQNMYRRSAEGTYRKYNF